MIWKHPFLLIGVACYALWISGCSSKEEGPAKSGQNPESTDPSPTEIKPEIYGSTTNSNIIIRDPKGIWVLKKTGKPYSGTVVFQLEENTWEEKFKDGVKISMRGWDEEKKPIELYSWNMDGTKKNNPTATPISLGE